MSFPSFLDKIKRFLIHYHSKYILSSFVCVNFIDGTHYLQIFIVQNYFLHNYRDNDKGKRNGFRTAAINL
jgi:hypothetical protein